MNRVSHTLSAGVVVVRRTGGEPRYLLLRAYNYWDFPKGEVGPGEEPLAAACREVAEETGLADLVFDWGEVFTETAPYGRGKMARYYLAESRAGEVVLGVNPELGRPEHHEYRWLTRDEAEPLVVERIRAVMEWADEVVSG